VVCRPAASAAGAAAPLPRLCLGWRELLHMPAQRQPHSDAVHALTPPPRAWQLAIHSLQSVLAAEFKPGDLEVGVVSVADPSFRRLADDVVETHLTNIAERD
jgi:hypothetical protein